METSTRADLSDDLMLFPSRREGLPGVLSEPEGDTSLRTRDRMLRLTMQEVAAVGPAAFNTRTVCAALDIAHPMVHYYFGSRDGLIAEAAHVLYARYVDLLWAAVEAAPQTALDRLRAFLAAGLRLNVEMRGWGAVLNYYPHFSNTIAAIVAERFQQEHTRLYVRNLAMMARLVGDVWADRITEGAPPEAPVTEPQPLPELDAIAGLMFTLHGLTVWRAGHIVPADGCSAPEQFADGIVETHLERLVTLIAASRPRDWSPDEESR
jgi:AcrR family transcriptional regulator